MPIQGQVARTPPSWMGPRRLPCGVTATLARSLGGVKRWVLVGKLAAVLSMTGSWAIKPSRRECTWTSFIYTLLCKHAWPL